MKTLFTILSIAICLAVRAQLSLQIGGGVSTQKKATLELSTQYDAGPLFLQAGYITHLAREISAGTYLNGSVGHAFNLSKTWSTEPAIGYTYVLRSTDNKSINTHGITYNLSIVKTYTQHALYGRAMYSERVVIGVVGVRYNF